MKNIFKIYLLIATFSLALQAQDVPESVSSETTSDLGAKTVVKPTSEASEVDESSSNNDIAGELESESLIATENAQSESSTSNLAERVTLEREGFSLNLPLGWTVSPSKEVGTPTEFLAPKVEGQKYQGNIKVMLFKDSIAINEMNAKKFEEKIQKKYSYLGYITGYNIRNYDFSSLDDGTSAVLYYSDFRASNTDLMQAHLLISGENNHYLITYTDILGHFEGEQSYIFLQTVWSTLSSIQLLHPQLTTLQTVGEYAPYIGILLCLLLGGFTLRTLWLKREDRIEPLDNSEFADDEAIMTSRIELESIIAQKVKAYDNPWSKQTDEQFNSMFENLNVDHQELSEADLLEDDEDELIAI